MKKTCNGNHAEHICFLAENNQFTVITSKVRKPEYICVNCGRAADAETSLCNPVAFEDIREQLEHVR